jgi:hypothetical protein
MMMILAVFPGPIPLVWGRRLPGDTRYNVIERLALMAWRAVRDIAGIIMTGDVTAYPGTTAPNSSGCCRDIKEALDGTER